MLSAYVLLIYVPWVTIFVFRTHRTVRAQIVMGDRRWKFIRQALEARSLEDTILRGVEGVAKGITEGISDARKKLKKDKKKEEAPADANPPGGETSPPDEAPKQITITSGIGQQDENSEDEDLDKTKVT